MISCCREGRREGVRVESQHKAGSRAPRGTWRRGKEEEGDLAERDRKVMPGRGHGNGSRSRWGGAHRWHMEHQEGNEATGVE